jgi:hypothetical protein
MRTFRGGMMDLVLGYELDRRLAGARTQRQHRGFVGKRDFTD